MNCVTGDKCGIKYYPEVGNMTCNLCNRACLGCTGAKSNDCLQCQPQYILTSTNDCQLLKCDNDQYLDFNSSKCQGIYIYIYIFTCRV